MLKRKRRQRVALVPQGVVAGAADAGNMENELELIE